MTAEQKQAEKAKRADKIRFVKVRVKGDAGPSLICTPAEADDYLKDDPSLEIWGETWMTQRSYEKLPEFDGF